MMESLELIASCDFFGLTSPLSIIRNFVTFIKNLLSSVSNFLSPLFASEQLSREEREWYNAIAPLILTAFHMQIPTNQHENSIINMRKARSPPASLSFKGQATKHTTVKWFVTTIGGRGMEKLFNIAIKEKRNNCEELRAILRVRSEPISSLSADQHCSKLDQPKFHSPA